MKIDYHDKPLKIFMAYVFAHGDLFAIDMVCALAVAVSAAAVTTPGTQPAEMSLVRELLRQVRLEEI